MKLIWYSISQVFWTWTNLKNFYPFFHSTTTTNGVDRGPREELLYDIQRVKKAGNFLEDIRIFLSGFHENEFEKIRLAIQTAGGVSLSQLTSSVTVSIIISVSGSYEFWKFYVKTHNLRVIMSYSYFFSIWLSKNKYRIISKFYVNST